MSVILRSYPAGRRVRLDDRVLCVLARVVEVPEDGVDLPAQWGTGIGDAVALAAHYTGHGRVSDVGHALLYAQSARAAGRHQPVYLSGPCCFWDLHYVDLTEEEEFTP